MWPTFGTLYSMLVIAFAAALLAVPFEDTQHRFSLDLPPQWTFAPQPGDVGGAAFRRVADGVLAHAMVRIMPFNQPVDLSAFFSKIGSAYSEEPGFRLLISEPTTVAGNGAQRRRFVTWINGDPKMPKIAEQRVTIVGTVGYVIHVETMAEYFGVFEVDFEHLFASFVPGKGLPPAPVLEPHHHTDLRALTGKWEAPGGAHALELSPGGIVILDGMRGHYHLDHGSLIFSLGAENDQMYTFMLGRGTLELTGANFATGQKFHKVHGKTAKKAKPAVKTATPDLAAP